MKKAEIKVGGLYSARISGRFVTVRVDAIREVPQGMRYDVTNLNTGRKTTFFSAAKFRSEVSKREAIIMGQDDGTEAREEIGGINTTAPGSFANDEQEASEGADPTTTTVATIEATPDSVSVLPAADLALATVPVSGLAAKIAAQSTGAAKLTAEQKEGIETALAIEAARGNGMRVLVLKAGAGCGKTFELLQLEQVLKGNGQYSAFNSPLVAESKTKFRRAACNTYHSLAFRAVGRKYAHRLGGARVKSYQIASILGIEDVNVPGEPWPVGSNEYKEAYDAAGYSDEKLAPEDFQPCPLRRLKASFLAGQVTAAIRKFCQSDEREVSLRCIGQFPGIDAAGERKNSDRVREYLLPFLKAAWDDLSATEGKLPFSHDCYVKIWQLGTGNDRPIIAADYVLIDEAQDLPPVFLDVLKQQTHAMLILVGDDNQQIYEWHGAVNAMAAFRGSPCKMLSQSFRFGQAVADVANTVLAELEEPTELVMKGLESIPSRICQVENPRCYLYRTNAGAIGRLMSAREEGKRAFLVGGSEEAVKFCQAAEDLQRGQGTSHPELGCFANWGEVQEYSKEAEGADLRLMIKLIDEFGAVDIRDALKAMPREEEADLVLSTAHRSKGREWKSVKLGPDFPLQNNMGDADRRLLYVACTRAQEELDVSQCPTFCGGWDKGGGEGGDIGAEGKKWIPGLDIVYTAPMPTTEELAAYRAAESARKAAAVPATANGVSAPVPAPNGTVAAPTSPQANGNGVAEYTWANMDGVWCLRGPQATEGQRVTVVKKNGDRSQVTVGKFIRNLRDLWFYAVR